MKRHTPKNTKKTEKTEITYTRLVKAFYYRAFATLESQIIREILPDDTADPMPVDIFLMPGRKEDKALYYDTAPRSLSLVVNLIVAVHNRVMDDIAKDKMDFINVLLAIPPTKINELNQTPEPRGIIGACIRERIIMTDSRIIVDVVNNALMLFVKALVEAILNCIIMNKHLPGTKTYTPKLCQVARMPQQLIQFARSIPAPVSRKKGAIASAAAPLAVEDAEDSEGSEGADE